MDRKTEFLNDCIVVDTEATSLDYKNAEIIELGYSIYDAGWKSNSYLYKSQTPITPELSAITNITPKMVVDKPYFADSVDVDFNYIVAHFQNVVAHNSVFDKGILERYTSAASKIPHICTLRLVRKLFINDDTVTQHNLQYLRYRFDFDLNSEVACHRAAADSLITGMLLERLVDVMIERGMLDESKPYKEQIETYLSAPLITDTMYFGKYKGQKMVDMPLNYWMWALENMTSLKEDSPDYDSDLAASVAAAMTTILEREESTQSN